MDKVKVYAIFDDGNSLGKRTHFRFSVEGTIGDAVDCFNKIHAEILWQTCSIKLIGILAEKDLLQPYGEAIPSLAHPDWKIQDMMEPSDFLVFRSAEADLDVAPTLDAKVKSDTGTADVTQTDESKPQIDRREDVRSLGIPERNEPVGAAVPAAPAPAALVTPLSKQGATDTMERIQGDSTKQVTNKNTKSKSSRHVGLATEVNRLQDYNNPPRSKNGAQRPTRTCRKRYLNDNDSKDTSQAPSEKTAKVQLKTTVEKKLLGTRHAAFSYSSHRVGSRFCYKDNDGIEHTVRVLNPARNKEFKPKWNERIVRLEGQGGKKVKIATSRLFRDSLKRRNLRAQRKKLEKEMRDKEKYEMAEFGPMTSIDGPLPLYDKAGALVIQDSRRVYYARNNETPQMIAKKFGVSSGKIVYDNRQLYPTLERNSRLRPRTLLVLPTEEPKEEAADCSTTEISETSQKEAVHSSHAHTRESIVPTQSEPCESVNKSDTESFSVAL